MLENIAQPLLKWYDKNKRTLPWRDKNNAYYTWVSEIMLQQTRVEAVKPYFQRFIRELPDVASLAAAPEERIVKLWEGLGYYSRVRNMQKAAIRVMEEYNGKIPEDFETLLSLKGIGRYTAGAISSIAYGHKVPAVDGNVLRVYSRLTESREDIMKQSVRKSVEEQLKEIMPEDRPGDFNQAMMEIGAVVCVPNGKAKCEECPLGRFCLARKHHAQIGKRQQHLGLREDSSGEGLEQGGAYQRQNCCPCKLEHSNEIDILAGGEFIHRHDVQGIEQGADQCEQVAPRDGEVAVEGHQPHTGDAQDSGQNVVSVGALLGQPPVEERDQYTVSSGKECVL